MNEYVLAAIIGLDEAEALLAVEPLHCSAAHERSSAKVCDGETQPTCMVRFGGGRQSSTRFAAKPSRPANLN
jgi:hypothetical protein